MLRNPKHKPSFLSAIFLSIFTTLAYMGYSIYSKIKEY